MQLIISAAPVVITLFALGLGVKSLQAALLGVTVATVGAVIAFPVPLTGLIPQLLHWLPILLEVLAIVAGGLLLSEVLRYAGVQTALASWIKTRAGGGVAAVLLVVHGITPFAESLTGFAIGITIGIPLLANFGLPPRKVAVLGLLGLCTIPWGSMGPGTMVAASLAELSFHDLGVVSGFVSFIPLIATGVTAAWLVSESGERVKAVLLGALSGVTLTVAITCFNMLFGTSPAGALGSLVIILLHFLRGSKTGRQPLPAIARKGLLSYFVLLVGVLAGGWYVRANGLSEAWRFLGSPALWLFVATFLFTRGLPAKLPTNRSWVSWLQVAPVTGLFIILGMVMAISGMAAYLAQAISAIGYAYLPIAPFVGATGGLITGSNVGANSMFATTQAAIARSLGISVLWFMATHNVAAAFLMMASPGKIEMAIQLTHADAAQHRRWIQRVLLGVALAVVTGLGILNMLLA